MSNQRKEKQAELFYTSKRLNSDLVVYQYGHHKCPKSHSYGPAKREYYLFHFIVKGRGIYRCGGREFALEAGTGFLIKPGETTFYQADAEEPWEYYFVAFHGMIAQKIVQEIAWDEGYIFHSDNADALKHRMRNLCKQRENGAGEEYRVLGELYLILAELIRQDNPKFEQKEKSKNESALELTIAYIKEHAMSPDCTVNGIARHANMDRTNLYRVFKKRFGISIIQYLQNYRMNQAAALLQNTDLPAKEIAIQVGMPDYPHFCKSFKLHNGHSPLEYRNMFRKGVTKKKEK